MNYSACLVVIVVDRCAPAGCQVMRKVFSRKEIDSCFRGNDNIHTHILKEDKNCQRKLLKDVQLVCIGSTALRWKRKTSRDY